MKKKRKLISELSEGFKALADQRIGRRALRTHIVKDNLSSSPTLTATQKQRSAESKPN